MLIYGDVNKPTVVLKHWKEYRYKDTLKVKHAHVNI